VLQPEDVGLFRDDGRRVGGLRRQEVADLAGVSTDYYLRLEQGRDRQPSDQVVLALARALHVGEFGLRHMRRLVQLQNQRPAAASRGLVETAARSLLDFWPLTPVAVVDANFDIVAANGVAQSLDDGLLTPGANLLLGLFDRRSRAEEDWLQTAERAVAALRFRCDPGDHRLQEIVGRLSIREPVFRSLWTLHDSRPWPDGVVRLALDDMGRFPFRFQALDIPSIEGCSIMAFHAASETAQAALASVAGSMRRIPTHAVSARA
jgi:transcriptional regulator with XRE-family HTH domain